MNIPSKIHCAIPSLIIESNSSNNAIWGQIFGNIQNQQDLIDLLKETGRSIFKINDITLSANPVIGASITIPQSAIQIVGNPMKVNDLVFGIVTFGAFKYYLFASVTAIAGVNVTLYIENSIKQTTYVEDAAYVHTDNNYTTTEKTKLAAIAEGAEVNVQSDYTETNTSSDAFIRNKPTIGNAKITIQKNSVKVDDFTLNQTADKTLNITLSKNDFGLSNVNNTSDMDKPISTATQSALNSINGGIADIAELIPQGTSDTNQLQNASQIDAKIGDGQTTFKLNGVQVGTTEANQTVDKTILFSFDKVSVGLGNVDNTADMDKPVSNATVARIAQWETALNNEITRAGNAEDNLETAIEAEETRATNAEAALTTALGAETTRATGVETTLQTNITNEATRATGVEATLTSAIADEESRATGAETTLQTNITTEVTRATDAEGALSIALNTETTRATDAETTLQSNIDSEITRATGAETTLQSNIESETTRATDAEATLQSNIDSEITRATGAESSLQEVKANIYERLAQGITIGNNIQGMHVKPNAPFAYYADWTLTASDGATFVRTDNNLVYTKADSTVVTLVENGVVLIEDYRIDDVFLITSMSGSFTNVNLFYRHFDIKDLDQRIGLVSALLTSDKSSVVNAINSLKGYVDGILESSEVSGSPYASYADFMVGAGATITPSKYAYVTFIETDTHPSGGNWDKIVVGETWRLDCSATAWSPTSNMTASSTSNVLDEAATNALKAAGNDTITNWLQSFRNNLKSLLAYVSNQEGNINYSTQEQWTGQYWINGEKIYRKTFTWVSITLAPGQYSPVLFTDATIGVMVKSESSRFMNNGWLTTFAMVDRNGAGAIRVGNSGGVSFGANENWYITIYYTKAQ